MDRIFSFSVTPLDAEALENINKLKEYSKKKHIKFSALVIKGIAKVVKELKL